MRSILIYLLTLFLLTTSANGQTHAAINGIAVEVDSTGNYSFIVSGHFAGHSSNTSGFPASTVLGGLDRMLAFHPNLLLHTGDLFMDIKKDSSNYRRALFNKLPFPIYNAVGNHDMDGDQYTPFGPTYFSIYVNSDLFIILDTELDNGDVSGAQFTFLKEELQLAASKRSKNIFIVSHRPVWGNGHPELDNLLEGNTRSLTGNNFEEEVLPLLYEANKNARIYWFAGSMGSSPACFLHHEENGVCYILSAIRDARRDAVLGVKVKNGDVTFKAIPLGDVAPASFETYDLEFWRNASSSPEGFNLRLLPYYIQSTVTHKAFWWGIGSALILLLGIWIVRRKRRTT